MWWAGRVFVRRGSLYSEQRNLHSGSATNFERASPAVEDAAAGSAKARNHQKPYLHSKPINTSTGPWQKKSSGGWRLFGLLCDISLEKTFFQ